MLANKVLLNIMIFLTIEGLIFSQISLDLVVACNNGACFDNTLKKICQQEVASKMK